ncbi:RsmB/NOP family class I SAM-dependent RNA methyltransferase [Candidatus Woesearchaeota archaeon]|nr:RsmB/NOP family class I SAM-dependent RNA methyltransferase [Candidatus Woesearchaeota archaeon]
MAKDFFLKRYRQLGGDIKNIKLNPSIRANTLKISAKELFERLRQRGMVLRKIPYVKNGFFVEKTRFKPAAAIEYLQGLYYIQESASQLPVEVLEPKMNEIILDMTASPGSKTTQIAAEMQNTGCIVAIDIKKLDALENNLERTGVENCIVYEMDALKAHDLGIKFDKILLDAPCSGNYVTDSKWFDKRDIEGIQRNAEMQKKLLKQAASLLKNNGILVYSTCSLEPEENELVVDWALKTLKLRLEPVRTIGSNGLVNVFGNSLIHEIKKTKRLWPHKTGTQGFFIAKFRK